MNKPDLSIIIPFAGEYPQALFTVQAIAQSLLDKINFEIIVVDNFCKELEDQWTVAKERAAKIINEDLYKQTRLLTADDINNIVNLVPNMSYKSSDSFAASCAAVKGNKWLKYIKFSERLSHWECKRIACEEAKADTFLFIDAHCIPSYGIDKMYDCYHSPSVYEDHCHSEIGTFHMPLTYKILEWHKLIYKLKIDKSFYGYSFTPAKECADPYEVPCMSTCGMMISRSIYEKVGGWPSGMFAYGGGENFMNFALAVTGHKKFIYPGVTLHHHGEKRDYHSTYDGTLFNRLLAHYLFGGKDLMESLGEESKGNQIVISEMIMGILENEDHLSHRKTITSNQKIDIKTWASAWDIN